MMRYAQAEAQKRKIDCAIIATPEEVARYLHKKAA
jgi:hypothetical protein